MALVLFIASYVVALFCCVVEIVGNGQRKYILGIEATKLAFTLINLVVNMAVCAYFLRRLKTKMHIHYDEYKLRIGVQQLSILVFAVSSLMDEFFLLRDVIQDQPSRIENFF